MSSGLIRISMTGLRTPIGISVSLCADSTVVPSPSESRRGNTVSMPPASRSSGRILMKGDEPGWPVARAMWMVSPSNLGVQAEVHSTAVMPFEVGTTGFRGGAVVALLDRDLLGDELLLEQHRADADRQDRQPKGDAVQRRSEAVDELALRAVGLVPPRPEEEDHQERQPAQAAKQQPPCHRALGSLLGLGALDGPAGLLEDRLDA